MGGSEKNWVKGKKKHTGLKHAKKIGITREINGIDVGRET
jgi:hypothetical protein